jgi:ParB family chromosome partitioning protein
MAKARMLKNVQLRTGTQDSRSVNIMVKDIPIGDIGIRENVRKDYTGIEELADSIRQHGLLQPITVYVDEGQYIVKTGHRRYLACQLLYQSEPERFHSIRCIVSNAENTAIIQLVENVQRVNLSQIDLVDALTALRTEGFTNKEIANVMGKTEGYVNNLFMGINEIHHDETLAELITHAGVSILDVAETKGIPDATERVKILAERKDGTLNRAEMRERIKASKGDCPAKKGKPVVSIMPSTLPSPPRIAATIAKERLDQYISDKVEDKWDDLALWEFYTWLLEQAKTHQVDRSGFISDAYKDDKEQAEKKEKNNRFLQGMRYE